MNGINGNTASSSSSSSSNGIHGNSHGHHTSHTDQQVVSRTSPRQQARKNMGMKRDGAFHGSSNTTEDREREHLLAHPNNRLHGHTD